MHKILKLNLRKKALHLQVLHDIHEDLPLRNAACANLLQCIHSENFTENIFFSDEATFHTRSKVDHHTCRISANECPDDFVQHWERDSANFSVWMGMTKSKIHCPFFFAEATVTGPIYLDMLQQFLMPQLVEEGIINTVVFQQDGTPCHYATIVRNYLNEQFPNRWIGRGSNRPWPATSSDLTPFGFFSLGDILHHKSTEQGLRP